MKKHWKVLTVLLLLTVFMVFPVSTAKAEPEFPIPDINLTVGTSQDPEDAVQSLQILGILTILSLAPAILIMMTSFTRIIIILSFLRNALGTQNMPPNQVLIGLALFLTFFIMSPVGTKINDEAIQPYVQGEIAQAEAAERSSDIIKDFMLKNTREKDLELFVGLSGAEVPVIKEELPLTTVIPAFLISELKTAFMAGFMIYIPFLVIDMIVASTLMAMGMMMLPPVMISLPFKILLFVLVDGWDLLTRTIVTGFNL